MSDIETVEIATGADPDGSVIWLHGLGADGHDFEPIVGRLHQPGRLHHRDPSLDEIAHGDHGQAPDDDRTAVAADEGREVEVSLQAHGRAPTIRIRSPATAPAA